MFPGALSQKVHSRACSDSHIFWRNAFRIRPYRVHGLRIMCVGDIYVCLPPSGPCRHPNSRTLERGKVQKAPRSAAALQCQHCCWELRRMPASKFLWQFFKHHPRLVQDGLVTFFCLTYNCRLVALLKYLVL